jgi:predicted enzyme related to lactoylglutathione lyase
MDNFTLSRIIFNMKDNAISWFEIPAEDLDRAQKFYETIFEIQMISMEFPGFQMRLFPISDPATGVGGALVKTSPGFYFSSESHGPLIYLNANPDVDSVLSKVEKAGGKVTIPKTLISEDNGYMGVFIDTEGNRIGVHSNPE